MARVSYIAQVALGGVAAVKLSEIFANEVSGNSFAIKCVSGAVAFGTDNTVTLANGWPCAAGEGFGADAQSFRDLWVIGGAADRIAVMVET